MNFSENSSEYSSVASCWDKKWGHITEKWINIIKKHNLVESEKKISCIDLCCGTGNLLKQLSKINKNDGSHFLGVDLNQDMLNMANNKDKRIAFELKEISEFIFPKTNYISCTYNSLNYLNSNKNSFEKIIINSCKSLIKNGKFIFDFKPYEFYQNIIKTKISNSNNDFYITKVLSKSDDFIDLEVTCFLNQGGDTYTKKIFKQREYYIDTNYLIKLIKKEKNIDLKFVKKNLDLSANIFDINTEMPIYCICENLS